MVGGRGGWAGMLLRVYRCTRSFKDSYTHSLSFITVDHAAHHSSKPFSSFISKSPLSMNMSKRFRSIPFSTFGLDDIDGMLAELEKELERTRKEREARGEPPVDEDEDYMGLELGRKERDSSAKAGQGEGVEDDEDDSSDDDFDDFDDDEESELQAEEEEEKQEKRFEECLENYQNLLRTMRNAGSLDEVYKLMDEIDQFEAKNFAVSYEYKVVGWLMQRLKKATGKERFMLLMKTQRALKQLEWKEKFDPENPANWGVIEQEDMGPRDDVEQDEEDEERDEEDKESEKTDENAAADKEDEDLSDEENKEEIFSEKIHSIDKEIKQKLAQMELSFGKQSRDLEEEIKELVEQRQSLTEESKQPLYRKGFEAKLIDVNRTCKVTKGGQVHKFSAIVACGNFNGVVGYGKGKGTAVPVALQRAYAKSFQNLQYIERFKEHTIAHAVQAQFKRTKIYLWPGAINTGMRANKTVESILYLGGLKNVKSKVVGSRNPQNTVKALFKALNMIETPNDIQEKFGRTVVESYLLK
ncbi:hypothetical protein SUGI_0613000 [Cryptomeria japonica]|uniref:protein Ycf2 n=1 Tax=Cryptomeria japonica TaxID=3369 RepID=UPI0024146EE2|nr:protein Ycf2 [Cryptomeria japonica]GLJ30852.1 hypothetical protein SUGI_0613000 [Cryptomeria japonica]